MDGSKTPYFFRCAENIVGERGCGLIQYTYSEYDRQLSQPNKLWRCPQCGSDVGSFEEPDDYTE